MLNSSATNHEKVMTGIKQPIRDTHYWQHQVSQWKKSGLTQRAYCKQHGFEPYQLSYYQRKFSGTLKKVKSSGFVSVSMPPKPSAQNNLSLHFPSGLHLSGIDSNNLDVIKQIVGFLL